MSAVIWRETIGNFRMALREARGPNYTLVCELTHDPVQVAIVPLGPDRSQALHTFARKVRRHQQLLSEDVEKQA